jgi:hypothetical protein
MGSSVAFRASALYVTVAPTLVVEPFLKSLKVWPFIEATLILSEKVAVTLAVGRTPVAPDAGLVLMTLGACVSERVSAQSGDEDRPSLVSLLSVVSEVVWAVAGNAITPLCWLLVSVGGGRVVGAGIA